MPNPVVPSRWRALIPSISGSRCERLQRLFQYPQLRYEEHSYKYTEAGTITPEYAADFCATNCVGGGGGGTPNPNLPAPTAVNATDGTYADKIRVSWNAVTAPAGIGAVTQYKIYRSISTNTDPNNATLVGTVSAPTTVFDDPVDADLAVGSIYRYWVRATNGSDTSAYSANDVGSADAPTADIDPVEDLRASYGHSVSAGGSVSLVWTSPAGATKYDIWRGETNVFAGATKIYSDVSPTSTTAFSSGTPAFWDNVGELLLVDTPPDPQTDYYYWVVAKKTSPPATSVESNDALGRVLAPSVYNGGNVSLTYSAPTQIVPGGVDKAWIVLRGGGGGGAGGNELYGGGGGGGSAVVVAGFPVAPGDSIELITSGPTPDTGNAPTGTDGAEGTTNEVQINGVTVMIANAGGGGVFNPAGSGDGGTAGTGGSSGSPIEGPFIYNGKPGLPSSGASGGRSGYPFGGRRLPQADRLTTSPYEGNGSNGSPGSGSKATPIDPAYSIGGKGTAGYSTIQWGG